MSLLDASSTISSEIKDYRMPKAFWQRTKTLSWENIGGKSWNDTLSWELVLLVTGSQPWLAWRASYKPIRETLILPVSLCSGSLISSIDVSCVLAYIHFELVNADPETLQVIGKALSSVVFCGLNWPRKKRQDKFRSTT
jgi:hypothetical protein